MVSIYIGNTDNDWFDYLQSTGPHVEVNFWRPSDANFQAIRAGEILAFRLKSPRNKIAGFGVFTTSSTLPIKTAWEAFGQKNGVQDLRQMINVIAQYREDGQATENTFIGCRILVQPVFLPELSWFDVPESWSKNIVGGKTYSTDSTEGLHLWDQLVTKSSQVNYDALGFMESSGTPSRFGEPTLIRPRLGQGAFRVGVVQAYGKQCALTDGRVLPALEAAHIKPYSAGGEHELTNGILLRKDIHSVFDAGYATFDDQLKFVVSSKVKDVFNNGNEYRRLHGQPLRLPKNTAARPSLEQIRWHQSARYLD